MHFYNSAHQFKTATDTFLFSSYYCHETSFIETIQDLEQISELFVFGTRHDTFFAQDVMISSASTMHGSTLTMCSHKTQTDIMGIVPNNIASGICLGLSV